MFKRVLMAAAVAAAVSAPAFAEVSITGSMEMNLLAIDYANGPTAFNVDRGLQLDFNGSDKLDVGGKLIWKVSQKITVGNTDAKAGDGNLNQNQWGNREAWVGFTGDLGTFKAGRQFLNSYLTLDWPYGQGGNWQLAERDWDGGAANGKLTAAIWAGSSVNYQSPSFSGFSFGAQYAIDTAPDSIQIGDASASTGWAVPKDYIVDLSANYSAGGLGVNAGYLFGKDAVGRLGDQDQWYVGATYGFDFGLSLRALYTGYSFQAPGAASQDGYDYIIGATYGWGKSFVKASWHSADQDNFNGSKDIASAEYGYSLSKNTVAYARYQWRSEEAGDLQYLMLGAWTGF